MSITRIDSSYRSTPRVTTRGSAALSSLRLCEPGRIIQVDSCLGDSSEPTPGERCDWASRPAFRSSILPGYGRKNPGTHVIFSGWTSRTSSVSRRRTAIGRTSRWYRNEAWHSPSKPVVESFPCIPRHLCSFLRGLCAATRRLAMSRGADLRRALHDQGPRGGGGACSSVVLE